VLSASQREALEAELEELCRAGDHRGATTLTIERYGPEILGYLVAVARTESDATEAFSVFSEDLWRGIAGFRWEASMRTWAYTLARNALRRLARDPHRKARKVPLSQSPEVFDLAEKVRTRTMEYLRTEIKDQIAELRKALDPEDQTLFVLRISRNMSWDEIARVMNEGSELDDAGVKRASAKLRKRFERAKNTLAELARERGIGGG
jgi:RNA polymerase sigma-70 factor (ECF subfamily)